MSYFSCISSIAAATPPVEEMIEHEKNGLLADFQDIDGFTRLANDVLDNPVSYRPLGQAGVEMIQSRYSLTHTLPKMLDMYRRTVAGIRRLGIGERTG